MSLEDYWGEALKEAAEPTLKRTRGDADLAEGKIREILEHLHDHLFSEDLTVKTLLAAVQCHDRAIRTQFLRVVGVPLQDYLESARLEVAAELLRIAPEISASEIGRGVGYSVESTFFVAFKRRYGIPPGEYRRRVLEDEPVEDREQMLEVHRRITEDVLWDGLRELEPEEGYELAWSGLDLESVAVFQELLRRARRAFRFDHRGGIEGVELALGMLPGLRHELPADQHSNLQIEALAILGNMKRLMADLDGAEITLAQAESEGRGRELPAKLETRLFLFRGLLRIYQRRLPEAGGLLEHAHAVAEATDSPALLVQVLSGRGLAAELAGDLDAALVDYRAARETTERLEPPDPYLIGSVCSHLTNALGALGDLDGAEEHLRLAWETVGNLGLEAIEARLLWLEGLLAFKRQRYESALDHLGGARRRLLASGEKVYAAVLDLDLALLHLSQGRSSEATSRAWDALPIFRALDLDPETLISVDLLDRSLRAQELTAGIVLGVRRGIRFSTAAPSSWTCS